MSENDDFDQKPPISGDELFMQTFPVHPMVACFIALPVERSSGESSVLLKKNHANVIMRGGDYVAHNSKYKNINMPEGMAARRILLFLFSIFYKDRKGYFTPSRSSIDFVNRFGYSSTKNRKMEIVKFNFEKLMRLRIKFKNPNDNMQVGFTSQNGFGDCMVSAEMIGSRYETIAYNPEFIFKMAFPVDFNHVVGTDKKNRFWNVYMFLIDVLPRIEKGKTKKITWSLMHDVFYHRPPNLAHFKNMFKQEVEDVFSIYPKAKSKVDMGDKTYLKLKYAPPPI